MNKASYYIQLLLLLILLTTVSISAFNFKENRLVFTTSDAFGYYMYLPSAFIYQDFKQLEWKDDIDKEYDLFKGNFYQSRLKNDHYVNKYYCGISILQSPFFLLAHGYAKFTDYEPDGFSRPYQIAILGASIFYFILGLCLLSSLLTNFFSTFHSATALLCVAFGSNIIQYVSIDAGQSHSYLFFVYCLILYICDKWHNQPVKVNAALVGFSIGLATCCRPTEAIAITIPLLWKFNLKEYSKWKFISANPSQLLLAVLFGTLALLPQFIYWQHTTGSWIHDVGSKWQFFNPNFRVLFGPEKGWFVYTPITILLIISLFKIKGYDFSKAIIYFVIFNIWIIIAWHDWRYGGSYSTRALSHSTAVVVLPFAAFLESIRSKYSKAVLYILLSYLTVTNLFQIYQYNKGIIHYDDMNWQYYKRIYWNINPSCLEFSLLDTKNWHDEIEVKQVIGKNNLIDTIFNPDDKKTLLVINSLNYDKTPHLLTSIQQITSRGIWGGKIKATITQNANNLKEQNIRMTHPNAKENEEVCYQFFTDLPSICKNCQLEIQIDQPTAIEIKSSEIKLERILIK